MQAGEHSEILSNSELPLEYRYAFVYRLQIEDLCAGIIHRGEPELHPRVHHKGDRLIALNSWGVDMRIGWQLHFGSQSDTVPRKADSIRLFERHVKVRGFDIIRYFVAQFGEKLTNNVISGVPVLIPDFEEFFPNHTLSIDKEIPGSRYAFVSFGLLGVHDLVGREDFGIRIGEQRELDFFPVREELQYFRVVIADCR